MAEPESNFPFLQDSNTIEYIKRSKVLFLLRGLPGSGKSTLVKQIQAAYAESAVCSADDYFLQEDGTYNYDKDT